MTLNVWTAKPCLSQLLTGWLLACTAVLPSQHARCGLLVCMRTHLSSAVVALMTQLMGPLALISAFMAFAPATSPYSVTTSLSCTHNPQTCRPLLKCTGRR